MTILDFFVYFFFEITPSTLDILIFKTSDRVILDVTKIIFLEIKKEKHFKTWLTKFWQLTI